MDKQQIGLMLALDAVKVRLYLRSFNDRLIIQKAVYLIQKAGLDLGYNFRWYLRGPYSSALTRDAFALAAELQHGETEHQGWRLDKSSKSRLGGLRKLFSISPASKRARRLECFACVHFLVTERQRRTKDVQLIKEDLCKHGKPFSDNEISKAIHDLSQHGLIQTAGTKQGHR